MLTALETDMRRFHWDTFRMLLLGKIITIKYNITAIVGSIFLQNKSRRASRRRSKIIDSFWILRIKYNHRWFISCVERALTVIRLVHSFVGWDFHIGVLWVHKRWYLGSDFNGYWKECGKYIFLCVKYYDLFFWLLFPILILYEF